MPNNKLGNRVKTSGSSKFKKNINLLNQEKIINLAIIKKQVKN